MHTSEMHDALNLMSDEGRKYASSSFNVIGYASRIKRLFDNPQNVPTTFNANEIERMEFGCMWTIAQAHFCAYITDKDYKENNPLGNGEEEWCLGFCYRADELIKIEKEGIIFHPSGKTYAERWEVKETSNEE